MGTTALHRMVAVNWWLIVVIVVVSVLVLGGIFYLLIVFSSPDDRNQAWMAKIVVVLSLSLACLLVLMLPLDVANKAAPDKFRIDSPVMGGGLDAPVMWEVLYILAMCFIVAIIPFAMFYYESYDTERPSIALQLRPALGYSVACATVFIGIVVVVYFATGHKADLRYKQYVVTVQNPIQPQYGVAMFDAARNETLYTYPIIPIPDVWITSPDPVMTVPTAFPVYIITILSVIGWFLLLIFGGVGLAALPMDLIQDFINRPKPISLSEYGKEKSVIARLSQQLIDIGERLENDQKEQGKRIARKLKSRINLFKMDVEALEAKFKQLEVAYKDQGGSPFIALGMLFLGFLSIMLSLLWIIHILLNNITKLYPFLNIMFIQLDQVFNLFGTLAYALFTFYLLWAVTKGCIKVGTRFLLFEIHPMKPGDTLMNSFLFNSMLILLTATAVVQFASQAFQAYASSTAIDSLFTTYVQSMKGINVAFQYFQWALVAIAVLAFIYLIIFPRRKTTDGYQMLHRKEKKK
eukprot:NODE_257_length_1725_cov_138.060859_g192_i0.p1 GENE.NODE_257_length_1725_cov_138.060859_g192_i0~~NODE_257_length_1725_cov_138.060859_g192_i0.p1  ORF type:complete len:521 (+),score=155.82 NODE_257_length_1725_cov_138.060859_g192_i0:34-1596(+)